MKYEKPKLIKLSDSSHHIVYGACTSGDGASGQGGGSCTGGGVVQGQGHCITGSLAHANPNP